MKALNTGAQNVILNTKIKGKIKRICPSLAFMSVKDHRIKLYIKLQCRLLNPNISDLGKSCKKCPG